ncbi:mechanosensitive ion channel family protein [Aristophania vespae]|uniref:mechanosensitive ion channel family protein n=1 Tax=Aristophania vespae TaxID=2697033 RepID=UPI0023514AD2|nr:mechanosensitive ion channel domain-containing protein [Aristophania vespae]UMM63854.1 hypothetical protein DM15PD_08310 [Aristophania vespae]
MPEKACDNAFRISESPPQKSAFMRRFLAVLVILLGLLPCATLAQTVPLTNAPPVTSAQADQLLNVLNDSKKRQAFVTTLKNLSDAQKAVEKNKQNNSLLDSAWNSISKASHKTIIQLHSLTKTVTNFTDTGPWVNHVMHTPSVQGEILRISTRVAILIVGGLILSYGIHFLLNAPRKRLELRAQRYNRDNIQKDLQDFQETKSTVDQQAKETVNDENKDSLSANKAQDEAERMRRQGALTRLMITFRRFPYTMGRFGMDLLAIAMFPLVALLIQTFDPAPDVRTMRAIWSIAWFAAVGFGVWVALLRALFAPERPWLRLTTINDNTAIFLFKGFYRIGNVIAWGVTALIILNDCTLPESISLSLAKILALIVHIMIAIMILGSRSNVKWLFNRAADHNKRLAPVLHFIGRFWWIVAIIFDIALWVVWAAEVPGGYQLILRLTARTIAALILMRVVSILAFGGLERFFTRLNDRNISKETATRILRYYPAAQRVTSVVILLLTIFAVAVALGAPVYAVIGLHTLGGRLLSSMVTIIIALLIGVVIWEMSNVAIEHKVHQLEREGSGNYRARTARIRTLQPMLRILLLVILTVVIGLTVLSQLGVNIAPLLAGASIFGVALGFGSQKLVQDFISGIFLLMENALTVGDAVTLSGTYGVVEKLSLRTVHVRANDGSMNIFPFSSLGQIINYDRDFARAMISAEVSYGTDTDKAVQALFDITKGLREDPDFKNLIIDDFQLWGVDSINESSVTIKGTLPTTTGGRWPVQRQFYRRMKKCFEERGIDIPFPTRTIHVINQGNADVSHSDLVKSGRSDPKQAQAENKPEA